MDPNMDRISRLPDELLCHILSFLPTKHAVATSILSTRWVNLCSFLPNIDLDDTLYLNPEKKGSNPALFITFLDRVLSLNRSKTIVKFRLRICDYHSEYLSEVNWFIHNVFSRNVVEFDLGICNYGPEEEDDDLVIDIPHSHSLRVLRVRCSGFITLPAFSGCFPSLRVFKVDVRLDEDDEWVTNLFPCLPALEKLSLVGNLINCEGVVFINVGGVGLRCLKLELSIDICGGCDARVCIDAPKLEYLRLKDGFRASYLIKNNHAIGGEVRLQVSDYEVDNFEEFNDDDDGPPRLGNFNELFQGLVNAGFISVAATTLEVIYLQRWNIPVLPSLTKLELNVHTGNWTLMLNWLESCPNLKVLFLNIKAKPEEFEEAMLDVPHVVPSCLSSCVKEINIMKLGKVDSDKILFYLLCNARVLDDLTVDSLMC